MLPVSTYAVTTVPSADPSPLGPWHGAPPVTEVTLAFPAEASVPIDPYCNSRPAPRNIGVAE